MKNRKKYLAGILTASLFTLPAYASNNETSLNDTGEFISSPNYASEGAVSFEKMRARRSAGFKGTGNFSRQELSRLGVKTNVTQQELESIKKLPVMSANGPISADSAESAEAIIGVDRRQRLYTTTYPARATVLITFSGGRCTGFLINRNTVATAGHCVHTGGPGGSWRPRSTFRIYPGYNTNTAPYGSCTARRLHSVNGWVNSGSHQYDYGAVKLNCNVGNSTGWYGYYWTSANLVNESVIIQGYPGDKPLNQWISADRNRCNSALKVFYKNDTTGGMSGSPVWNDTRFPNSASVFGIHAYAPFGNTGCVRNNNSGTRINQPRFNNLTNWKNS